MDIRKTSSLQIDTQQQPLNRKVGSGDLINSTDGSFAKTLAGLQVQSEQPQKLSKATLSQPESIQFSNHAIERMLRRGIHYNNEDLLKLNEAVQKAAAKGSKDTLVLMNDSALIVSVKNKMVVTVMDKNALKENVFTNIDSTVVI